MISKTSLFNAGIYKSTVKRNIWGSILFFAIIYLFSTMPLVSEIKYISGTYTNAIPYIYRSNFFMPTMVVCMFVPTVVAMLAYRFVHSKKAAIFTHSLPVNRNAIYVSTLLGAFTLMFAPVVLNGIILMFLSVTSYSGYFTIANCFVWIALHIFFLFVMFSVAIFAVMLTGNTISTPVINFVLHVFVLAIAAEMSYLAYEYLFGYTNDQIALEFIAKNHPVTWFMTQADDIGYQIETTKTALLKESWIYLAFGILMYVFSFVLYKKRMIEKAEDVASFNVLNPIYKYLVTFIVSFGAYAVFKDIFESSFVSTATGVIITTAIAYFGCEMILKKTFAVWKSYKGLICYGGVFCVILCVFAFTSFFGFETRVPEVEDIESVSVHHYYYGRQKPHVNEADIIEYAVKIHKDIIDEYKSGSIEREDEMSYAYAYGSIGRHYNNSTRIHIEYKLKNGKELLREYIISEKYKNEIMDYMYKSDRYVMSNEEFFIAEDVIGIRFPDRETYISDIKQISELMDCIKKDILILDYTDMHIESQHHSYVLELDLPKNADDEEYVINQTSVRINSNYSNTIEWLKQNGYWENLKYKYTQEVCIGKLEENITRNIYDIDKAIFTIKDEASLNTLSEYVSTMKIKEGDYQYAIYTLDKEDRIIPQTVLTDAQFNEIKQLLNLE